MKAYKETIRSEARKVIDGAMMGGSMSLGMSRTNMRLIAQIYGVAPAKVDADVQKLVMNPRFVREVKGF